MVEVTCSFCGGKGKDPFGIMSWSSTCCVCGGGGVVQVPALHGRCAHCRGTGAVGRIEAEFGDSAAVAQRRLQEWVAGRRFDEKLRGGSLRNPGSLRQVRATVDLYQAEIDSLLARTRTLAVSMVRRADSMEGGGGTLDGLSVSVEDALVDWQRELVVYAGLEHNTAATIDSLAGFVLGRQQSFVIREGQPVFLSRADAARFRELTANLGTLAGREKNWAGALLGRRPAWMSALAESARPQFGRNILSDRASN